MSQPELLWHLPQSIAVPAYVAGTPYTGQITNLPPGNYRVLVEDVPAGCTTSAQAIIAQDIPTLALIVIPMPIVMIQTDIW